MARRLATTLLFTSLFSSFAFAQESNVPSCSPDNKCPEDAPCCSAYGNCGVGAYCLGGCDPLSSNSLDSCMPAPACKSEDYKLNSLDGISSDTKYLGDAGSANWVSTGKPVEYNGDGILLTMAPDTVGTVMASTNYVWYGKVSTTMTTSRGQGVVTAFILMSDVKDEIDFESVGIEVENVQSNYYALGQIDYTRSENLTVSNSFENTHTYTIDWTPESIIWSIDGEERRTVKRDDTFNETTNKYDYPQTPSRVMLSVWPAGLPTNGEGTIEWAGGLVDWNSEYMQNGYYYALIKDVTVECYDPPSDVKKSGSKAYKYTDDSGLQDSVAIVDDDTTLASLKATGEDPEINPAASKSAASAAASDKASQDDEDKKDEKDDKPDKEPESVPGLTGAGERSENVATGQGDSGSDNNDSSGGQQTGGSGSNDEDGTEGTSFSQGSGSTDDNASQSPNAAVKEQPVKGSVFAVVVAALGLLVL